MEWLGVLIAVGAVVIGVPFTIIMYVEFGGHLIGDLIERPPWSKQVRIIQGVLVPFVALAVWQLNFRQFAYGLTAVIFFGWAVIWTRTLVRGETWLWQRDTRVNAEWAGPIVLFGLGAGFLSSAISPWF